MFCSSTSLKPCGIANSGSDVDLAIETLSAKYPTTLVVVTLGQKGAAQVMEGLSISAVLKKLTPSWTRLGAGDALTRDSFFTGVLI